MRTRLGWAMVLAVAVSAGPAGARDAERLEPYRDTRKDGATIDWLAGQTSVMGRTLSPYDISSPLYLRMAKGAAEQVARDRMLSFLRTLRVDSDHLLGDDPGRLERLKQLLAKTTAPAPHAVNGSIVTVVLNVPVYGDAGIVGLVLPPPPGGEHQTTVVETPGSRETGTSGPAAGTHTGLVLDATGLSAAAPSLLPRIVDETGRLVYGPESADPRSARARGLAAFAIKGATKTGGPHVTDTREGDNPMRLIAQRLLGAAGTEFVVSTSDAEILLAAAAQSPFLKECRVVILLPRYGGAAPTQVVRPVTKAIEPGKQR